MHTNRTPVCGGQFVDNDGPSANYTNNLDSTTTICPTTPGQIVSVVFNTFDTEATYDALYVFDGNSIGAPQITSTNPAGNVPGGLAGGFWGTAVPGPFVSTSPDGCLTFRFISDNTQNRPGWTANVVCAQDSDKIVLVAFVDSNSNGIKDTGELLFPHGSFIYQQNSDGINVNGYSPTGQFALFDTNPANTYSFSYALQSQFASYYNSGTTTYSNISIAVGSGPQFLYFPITLTQSYNDVTVSIAPVTAPRPGFTYVNRITYKNQGIATANGTITFAKPPQITTFTVSQAGAVNNVSGFTYAFTNLLPNETRTFTVTMNVPLVPTVNINDVITATASITAPADDMDATNNASSNSQIVVNSWDPNDKMESRGKTIPFNTFTQDDYFFYTIRFQNNGTANAIDVKIEDVLNVLKIDAESVRMVSASHNYTMKRINNRLVWDFKNIFLTTSTANENGSRGYVQFKVKLIPGFQAGDIIPNNASIYFDSNPAIVTATFNSKFTVPLAVETFDSNSLALYPNPATNSVNIDLINTNEQISRVVFYDILGKIVKAVSTTATESLTVDVSDFPKGVYLVEITSDTNMKLSKKLVIQ
ncbi:MAG: T9SS type A sorting domain-containing protein [Flavobacterium sp. JAD_PAG50586_2]|nr:MAG: T9SS type A sorting domain-containing protein [Flavobacterium sp. JAD_PAG50586_2]